MTRNVTTSFRRSAEASFADEVDLCFLTISHPLLLEPIRVVWDTKDYVYGGETFTGFPFDIELLTDDEQPPTARLAIQNIDPRIGDTIRSLGTPARLKIELLSSADFNTAVDPRTESGTGDNLGVLTVHCDGIDASTTFTDSSPSVHTITANGNAQVDTAQSVFGGAALLLDGTGDYLACTGSLTDFNFGTGDFTIDFRMRPANIVADQSLVGDNGPTNGSTMIAFNGSAANTIAIGRSQVAWDTASSALAWTIGQWYHIAISRSGTSMKIFRDGITVGSGVNSNSYDLLNATGLFIGARQFASGVGGPGNYFNGHVDELRIIKGTALYTADFTPSTAAYATASATVIYSADKLFLTNVTVDIMTISGTIQGWDYLQRVWPGQRATQASFPGLFR